MSYSEYDLHSAVNTTIVTAGDSNVRIIEPEPEYIHYESPAMVTVELVGKRVVSLVVMDRDGKQHILPTAK